MLGPSLYHRAMDISAVSQSPFVVVTFIVAPAMLTNAASVLAMSTINRMLRTRERMSELYAFSESGPGPDRDADYILSQVNRVERQGILLLRALRAIYAALGSFAAATLVTLLAAVFEQTHFTTLYRPLTTTGIIAGSFGVAALTVGTFDLFRATRLSMLNISEEAAVIRQRQAQRAQGLAVGSQQGRDC